MDGYTVFCRNQYTYKHTHNEMRSASMTLTMALNMYALGDAATPESHHFH